MVCCGGKENPDGVDHVGVEIWHPSEQVDVNTDVTLIKQTVIKAFVLNSKTNKQTITV